MTNTLKGKVVKHMIEVIQDWRGSEVYLEELGVELTENMVADGTIEFSTALTIKKITRFYREYGVVQQSLIDEGVASYVNPFLEPEKFDTIAYAEVGYDVCQEILPKLEELDYKVYGEKVELKQHLIDNIVKLLEENVAECPEYL